jgi:hypothetical protein
VSYRDMASSGLRLRLAGRWSWAGEITAAAARLQTLPSGRPVRTITTFGKANAEANGTPADSTRQPGSQARPRREISGQPAAQVTTSRAQDRG